MLSFVFLTVLSFEVWVNIFFRQWFALCDFIARYWSMLNIMLFFYAFFMVFEKRINLIICLFKRVIINIFIIIIMAQIGLLH